MKKASVNTIANLISRIWTMVANFLFVPLYIKFLGTEAYGLVTFFVTLQTILNLLGIGLSKTLRREFAADESTEKTKLYKYKILRSTEFVYLFIALLIIILCVFGSTFIAQKWLNIETLPVDTVKLTISLMGVSIAVQLLANLYLGCLFGLEKQVMANILQIGWSIIKNVGVILVISLVSSDVRCFYLWYCITDIIYLLIVRTVLIRYLSMSTDVLKWEVKDLRNLKYIYKFASGIMIISMGYAINTQIDKIIISGKFSLIEVGAYNTSYNLGYVVSAIAAAVGIAAFSRFSYLYSQGNFIKQKQTFEELNKKTNIVICTIGAFVAIYSKELIMLWTGDVNITTIVERVAPLIIIGTTLSAVQELPYEYFLSSGVTIVNNALTLVNILYVITITPKFINKFGLVGAGYAWLLQMFIGTTVYLLIFYNKYFKGYVLKKLIYDLFLPLMGSVIIAFTIKKTILIGLSIHMTVLFAIISGLLSLLFWFLIFDRDIFGEIKKIRFRRKNK